MTSKYAITLLAAFALSLAFSGTSQAAVIAEDDATDPVYTDFDLWADGDDGGTGFGPWAAAAYGGVPTMEVDTDTPEPDNALGTPAFRIATGGVFGSFYAERTFDAPMEVGQTFSMSMDTFSLAVPGEPGKDFGISFNSAGGTRLMVYGYYARFAPDFYGTDFMGINAPTATNNLAGGASLPPDPLSGIEWQTDYSFADGSDGFTLLLDLPTIDTYRLRIIDDSVTKLDITGQMYGGALTGQGLNEISIFGEDQGDDFSTEPGGVLYFSDLKIETPEGLAGDFDSDGDVDGRDFLRWQRGGSPSPLSASDLSAWQSGYGAPLVALSAVPEPTALGLCVIAAISWFGLPCRSQAGRKQIR